MRAEILLPNGIILSKEHALYIREDDTLAVADLHLGYEASLQAERVAIPRFQLDQMLGMLDRALKKYKPERIIINGDLKHGFGRNLGQEWDEVETLLDRLENLEMVVIRGNHDNYLKTILAKRNIDLVEHYILPSGKAEFVHGHKLAKRKAKLRIYGHEHPVVRLRDDIGALVTLPCFLYDESNNFIVMPAFSPLASGTNVASPTENYMIDELKGLDLDSASVYAIGEDGLLDFGELANIKDIPESL
jgi:putative SbcD/Mre11-related phosphoesterase